MVPGLGNQIYPNAMGCSRGRLAIARASDMETDRQGFWWADIGPVWGPLLGSYGSRSEAVAAERMWLARRA